MATIQEVNAQINQADAEYAKIVEAHKQYSGMAGSVAADNAFKPQFDTINARRNQLVVERQNVATQEAQAAEAAKQSELDNPFRQAQLQFVTQLQQRMSGQAPTAAEMAGKVAQEQTQAGLASQAASARGRVNPALLQKAMMEQQARSQQALATQTNVAKQQELEGYGSQLAQARQGEQGLINAQTQQGQFEKELASKYYGIDVTKGLEQQKIDVAKEGQDKSLLGGVLGTIGTVGSALITKSDENAKKNVRSGAEDIQSFLDAIAAHKYEYKDKSNGEGERVSPMAQELEKSKMGSDMVIDTPDGKMVDYGKGFGAILAAQAELNKRLKKLEG
jgi:hypothetical protein